MNINYNSVSLLTLDSLKDYFSQYGTVSDINLKYDQASGKSRCVLIPGVSFVKLHS